MAFSWLAFCQRHHLAYDESGAHTAKANLYIACPFCREPDPEKRRMGLHVASPMWGCWKDPRHRGKDPARLIRAVLNCSWPQALAEAKEEGGVRSPIDALRARLGRLGQLEKPKPEGLRLPPQFVPFAGERLPPLSWYRAYLQRRGFPGKHADRLADEYELLAGTEGRWDRRIILPMQLLDGTLIGWSGRSIAKSAKLRYDTEGPTGRILYNGHRCAKEGGRILAVVEGPFDALKVDYYGREFGLRSTALTGLGGVNKVGLVTQVFEEGGYEEVLVLLDFKERAKGLAMQATLRHLPSRVGQGPEGVKDPGDLTRHQVWALAKG